MPQVENPRLSVYVRARDRDAWLAGRDCDPCRV